ncbi:AAA family ATPase, partial [Kitasatospora sp. NPDC004240]
MVRALVAGVGEFPERDLSEKKQARGIVVFRSLPAVTEAVQDLTSALERAGAETGDPLLECTKKIFKRAWKKLRDHGRRGESVVVHFAGHGYKSKSGILYLAASGADTRRLTRTCVSVGKLLEGAEESERPVLFLLDVCGAGQAIVQQQLAELAARRPQSAARNVWIIGACAKDDITYGARFTTATAEILHQLADGDLDIDPTQEYVPITTLAEAIDRQLAHTDAAAGHPRQHVVRSPHVHATPQSAPFFPNRAYSLDPRSRLLAGMDQRLRDFALACSPGLDPLHFATRAAGEPHARDILFSGRTSQLQKIQDWTNRSSTEPEHRLLVVTGSPGIGKSALLGVTTCLLHPELKEIGDRVARFVEDFYPRQPATVLAIHARQLTLQQITESLRGQLRQQRNGKAVSAEAHESSPQSNDRGQAAATALVRDLREVSDVLVILDALDEAEDPVSVLNELLLPLAAAVGKEGTGCRVIIGTRPWWDTLPALHAYLNEHPAAELNLDPADDDGLRALVDDLDIYLRKLLRPRSPDDRDHVHTIADRLAKFSDHGAFLVAAVYANYITTSPERTPAEPPRTVTEVFDLHVEALAATEPWIRPVLTVLGQARGQGMPLDLIHEAALAHDPPAPGQRTPQRADTRRALAKADFYLRSTPETDHCLLYRYFHQALTDHTHRLTSPATVYAALLDTVPRTPGGFPDWSRARPYLLRHAVDHAVAVDHTAFDQLIRDPSYLIHAEPDNLTAYLHHAVSEEAVLCAHIYRSTTAHHSERHRTAVRRDLLALDAASWRRSDLAHAFAATAVDGQPALAEPLWSTNRTAHPARRHTLQGHTQAVNQVTALVLPDDTPVAITTGADQTAIVWNLNTGRRRHTLRGHTDSVNQVTALVLPDDTPVAITTSHDSTAIVWDLTTGRRRHTLQGHTGWVNQVTAQVLRDGTPVAITTGADRTAIVWNLNTGRRRHTLRGHTDSVNHVAALALPYDFPVVITASHDSTAIVWDLSTGQRRLILQGHTRAMHQVTALVLPDGTPVAITTNGDSTATVWDLETGRPRHMLRFHSDSRIPVGTSVMPDGTPIAVTIGTEYEAAVWNLVTGKFIHHLPRETSSVRAFSTLVLPDTTPVAITVGDRKVTVWDLAAGLRTHTFLGHTSWVNQVTTLVLPDITPLAVTVSDDSTAIVWDLTTGQRRHTFEGHTDSVNQVAALALDYASPIAITASSDGTAIVWDLATGQRRHTHQARHELTSVAVLGLSDDPPVAITASSDGTADAWNPLTGEHRCTLQG